MPSDTQQIMVLNYIAERLAMQNPNSNALLLADEAFNLSASLGYKYGMAEAICNKCFYYSQILNLDSASVFLKNSFVHKNLYSKIPLAKLYFSKGNYYRIIRKYKQSNDTLLASINILEERLKEIDTVNNIQEKVILFEALGNTYHFLGHLYIDRNERDVALKHYQKALKIFSSNNDKDNIAIVLSNIGRLYDKNDDYDNSRNYYLRGLGFATRAQNNHVISLCFNNLGIIAENRGEYLFALDYYHQSIELRKKIGDKSGLAATLNNIGNIYRKQGDITKALDYLHQSTKLKEEINDKRGVAISLNNIGLIYYEQKDYKKALEYYFQSLELRLLVDDMSGVAGSYNNIGIVYRNLSDHPKALEYYEKSLAIRQEIGDKRGISIMLNNIGIVYKSQGDLEKALDYYKKSLSILEEIGYKNYISSTLNNIGSVYFERQDYEAALRYGQKAYQIAKETGNPSQIRMSSKLLNDIYQEKGDYKKALLYYEEQIVMRDSISNSENQKIAEKTHWQHEYEKKSLSDSLRHAQALEVKNLLLEKKQVESKRQMVVIYALFAVFIMMIALAILIFRSYRAKMVANQLITEKNNMLEQAYEEIKATSEALASKNEILNQQRHEIENQRNSLSDLNSELQSINEEIIAQKEELERTQEQLVLSEKMASIGVLTAGIAHEINNPINFVYGGVNSIMRDLADVEQVLKIIKDVETSDLKPDQIVKEIIKRKKEYDFDEAYRAIGETIIDIKLGAQRTAEIVQGLRDFSRSESDDFGFTDINKTIEGVLVLLKNKYKSHVEIVKDLDTSLPDIECKAGKVNQVIMNLVSNAIDAITNNGIIQITSKMVDGKCSISVKDNGLGIKPEILPKIFDPFFTTKKVGHGTGLGLSISYGIIEEHRGTIDVKSEVGKGTEFIVTLPTKQ
jgi:signal transduction histidine kinase/Tfp pilus assembly protein PilF